MITIEKTARGSDGKVAVTFAMSPIDCCDCLYLVGWFDEWDASVYRMERSDNGMWSLTLELEPGCEYQYGFRTADGRWLSDPAKPVTADIAGLRHSFIISNSAIKTH